MKPATTLGLIVFFCFLRGGFAQDCSIDSLQNLISQSSNDSIKVELLNQAAWCCRLESKFHRGISNANEAKNLAKHMHLVSEEARAYFTLGCIYFEISDYQEALNNHLASLAIRESLKDSLNMAISYNNVAISYANLGDHSQSLSFHFKALGLYESTGNKKGAAGSYTNMGLIYSGDGNYKEALKSHGKSLEIMRQIGNKQGEAIALINIGGVYYSLQNYMEALQHHSLALQLMTEVKNKRGIANCQKNIGSCYEKQGQYQEALNYFLKSLALSEEIYDKKGVAGTKLLIGDLKIIYGALNEAEIYYQEALDMAKAIANKNIIKNCYKSISRLDSIKGNYAAALLNYKLFTLYKDSLLNEESQRQSRQLMAQFETGKKENEIQLLKKEKEIKALELEKRYAEIKLEKLASRQKSQQIEFLSNDKLNQQLKLQMKSREVEIQKAEIETRKRENELLKSEKELQKAMAGRQFVLRNSILSVSVLIIIIGLLLFNRYRIVQTQRQLKERSRISSDLHDEIGSTLSSISMFSSYALSEMEARNTTEAKSMLKEIKEASKEMSDELSDIVWTVNPRHDSFESVINRLKNFAVNVTQSRNIELSFHAPEELNNFPVSMEKRRNLFLICKEAINNAAKYSECKHLIVRVKKELTGLFVSIQDDGIGIPYRFHQPEREPEGNGLKNMKQRAETMKAILNLHSEPGKGTTIELKLSV